MGGSLIPIVVYRDGDGSLRTDPAELIISLLGCAGLRNPVDLPANLVASNDCFACLSL